MKVIVSDSCCLIDLELASLLNALLALPCEVWMPELSFKSELLSLSEQRKTELLGLGLQVKAFSSVEMQNIQALQQAIPALSHQDCAAFVLAADTPESVLLTSDKRLRNHAMQSQVAVHGLLWLVELFWQKQLVPVALLLQALEDWQSDPSVRLPQAELKQLKMRLKQDLLN
ncbi:MAG: hypothetical protein AB7I41_15120 [Candidatus Sericytochromatia bacterium]